MMEKKGGFIQDNDKVKCTAGGDAYWLNYYTIKDFISRNTNSRKNVRLVINGNAFAFVYSSSDSPYFNIMRGDNNNYWPDLPN